MQYVWVILLFLPSALSQSNGRFRVVVPDAHVFSVLGSDVVLSCSVREDYNTNIMVNAVDLKVNWSRSDLNDSLVHLYGNHKDPNTDQIPSYRGRTAVFKEQLKNGNVSLKLSNVRITDEGEYRCRVDSTTWKSDKTIKLSVEAVGSEPVITVEKYDYESGEFSLLCESKGWYPEPELQWRNIKDDNLTAETDTQRVADLFNVKSRITVEEIDSFYCTVTQRVHVKKGLIDAQTLQKFVPSEAGKIVGITIGVLLLVGVLAGVVFYIYKEKRKKEEEINEEKRKKEEEINEVTSLLNSDKDGRLQHHNLSQHQWNYVEETLLKSEEDLNEFNLRKFDPTARGVEKLKKVIASSKKALLKQCYLTEKSCEVLASVLKSENSLTELDLSLNKQFQDSGVKKLREGLKSSHCKLQNLRLEECDLKEKSCEHLASVLKSENSKLTELNLSQNTGLKDSGVKKLCEGLKNENCKLKKLWLEDCVLTMKSCADLAEVFKLKNSKLIELNLSKNRGLKDLGVKNLCDGLKNKNCKLKMLRLEHCDLGKESCKHLVEVFKSANSLIELHLSTNMGLEDSGVEKLCDGLKDENCKLQKLRLAECSIKNAGFAALASALIGNPSSPLEELDLSGNEIKESELKLLSKLKDTLPNLKVKLDKCRITDEGCAAQASENPSSPLEEQDLSSNDLKESEQKLLTDDTCV